MCKSPAALDDTTPPRRAGPTVLDVRLSALSCWYLTGLLAALGFSFGFYLVKPANGVAKERRELLDAFTWMDGKWYKQIGTEGYHYDATDRSNIAFFPAYPLLGRAVMSITGLPAEAALLIVSNLSLLAALAMLAFYARTRYADGPSDLADYTVLAAALYPTGCFFRLGYSELTCLLLMVLAMYAMLRRRPLWAIAMIVGLATAARPVGVALLLPFAIHIFRAHPSPSGTGQVRESAGNPSHAGRGRVRGMAIREGEASRVRLGLVWGRLALYLPIACWGLLAFMVFQYHAFGDPLAVAKAHDHWRIRPPVPWQEKAAALARLEPARSVYESGSRGFWPSFDRHCIPWFSLQFANPLFFLAGVGLMALGAWRHWLSVEEVSLGALMLLIPYVTRAYEMGMGSMGRFTAVVFPVYLVLGRLLLRLPGTLQPALLALSGLFLAVYTALYAGGYVIF